MVGSNLPQDIAIKSQLNGRYEKLLTNDALTFVASLQREFSSQRTKLLDTRTKRQAEIDAGHFPDFLVETKSVRDDKTWQVAATPPDLENRCVEITGPVDRKMIINALNCGANVFMADFEDATSPTWENVIDGQLNLIDAISGDMSFTNQNGKEYKLNEKTATLVVRPRGWHLDEKHVFVDDKPISASLFDFGIYFFHNAKALLAKGSGPYFYLPKLESHLEARLWNDVFRMAQDLLNIPQGTIRATVLIETILAAFEMEEILFELKEHSAGLNAGRWDYIFSAIKKFRNHKKCVLPDRAQISMSVPFMRSYAELLVKTCHKRGAHAIGGMAAFIPSRDPEVNRIAMTKVMEDKNRESQNGFDGTWVAHPGLIHIARESFSQVLNGNSHQKNVLREDVQVTAKDLLNFDIDGGKITEQGLRTNINVAVLYIESWLSGTGAAALYNLMEDAATAEISRAQIWQWLSTQSNLEDGRVVDEALFNKLLIEEIGEIQSLVGKERFENGKFDLASQILTKLIIDKNFTEFLTLSAYKYLN